MPGWVSDADADADVTVEITLSADDLRMLDYNARKRRLGSIRKYQMYEGKTDVDVNAPSKHVKEPGGQQVGAEAAIAYEVHRLVNGR